MIKIYIVFLLFLILILTNSSCNIAEHSPSPIEPVPSDRQLAWHEWEYYAFIHFGINTFTGDEWGYGDKSPDLFNPTDFDADETVRLFRDAGMRAVVLTAKHHDGFCLWPSRYTEYSVKNSPWQEGSGDVVREFAEACKRYDMKFGIYISPWDRNHPDYGKPEYNEYYLQQLEELLTEYGDIVEVWFDGARGDEGYYGGAREKRVIDPVIYYEWDEYWSLVRRLQPDAVMFSDVGPDLRWVGNEEGFAGETNWAMYTPAPREGTIPAPGNSQYLDAEEGHRDGKYWMPAECPVSIRPGWFYHEHENELVKTPEELLELYFNTVGRNAALLLNVPLDRRGRVTRPDSIALMEFKHLRDTIFEHDYARNASAESSNYRANDSRFSPDNMFDGNPATYWATDDTIHNAYTVLQLNEPTTFDCLLLQEYIRLGQRVESFTVERWNGNEWIEIVSATTIGYKRLLRFEPVTTDMIRLVIHGSRASPLISAFSIYSRHHV
jgi:alpha-L-fucosidase